jgi:hypothetical protein
VASPGGPEGELPGGTRPDEGGRGNNAERSARHVHTESRELSSPELHSPARHERRPAHHHRPPAARGGVHFGHRTERWNPRMKPYIYGARNGIHIIDLQQTAGLFRRAYAFIRQTTAEGKPVLFVGTKKQAADVMAARGPARRSVLRVQPLAGRHADQLDDGSSVGRQAAWHRAHEPGRHLRADHEEGGADARAQARQARAQPRRHQGHAEAAGRGVRDRPGEGAHRRGRGEPPRRAGGGGGGHQRRPAPDQVRDPGQRRRDPCDQAVLRPHRGRLPSRAPSSASPARSTTRTRAATPSRSA